MSDGMPRSMVVARLDSEGIEVPEGYTEYRTFAWNMMASEAHDVISRMPEGSLFRMMVVLPEEEEA